MRGKHDENDIERPNGRSTTGILRRREFLGGIAMVTLAGCASSDDGDDDGGNGNGNGNGNGDDDGGNGDDDGGNGNGNGNGNGEETALYSEGDDLVLGIEAFDDENDEWVRDDELNPRFDAVFADDDESIVVAIGVEVYDDVDEAKDEFELMKASVADPNDYPIGDEAFWGESDGAGVMVFRHSNATGEVYAARQAGLNIIPDTSRAQHYAGIMFDDWPN